MRSRVTSSYTFLASFVRLYTDMVKNTRRAFTVQEKCAIINEIENGRSQSDICAKMKLKSSTVSSIWKNRQRIKEDWNISEHKKKMRLPTHLKVDEMLLKWFQEQKAKDIVVNGPMLQSKAQEFGKIIGDEFKCSNGWLDRFKKRHNIVLRPAGADKKLVNDWFTREWNAISSDYTLDNIFNADETGVFFRVMPDIADELKGEECNEGQMAEERITVMVCANASGSEKRKLLIVGQDEQAQSFNNIASPADYSNHEKAWLTPQIIVDYLKKWDSELIKQSRKVLLIVRNCSTHTQVQLQNIHIEFFPSSVTSVMQPMNQGVIWKLKQIYRMQMLMKSTELQEGSGGTTDFSLWDTINLLCQAWEKVSSETIRSSFHRSGLVTNINQSMDCVPEDEISLSDWMTISNLLDLDRFDNYVSVDSNLRTAEELAACNLITLEEIKTEHQTGEAEESVVTTEEALCCFRRLKQYFGQECSTEAIFLSLNQIELTLQERNMKEENYIDVKFNEN